MPITGLRHDGSDPGLDPLVEVRAEHPRPGVALVRAAGELDLLGAPELRSRLADEVAAVDGAVVLDLGGVTFLGSSGLAVLVEARDAAALRGVELRLVSSNRAVLRPMACTGLFDIFDIYPSVEEALG